MPSEQTSFDEFAFRQMVRRAWGGECCPLALRKRVEAAIAPASLPIDTPLRAGERPLRIGRSPWVWAAAAGVVLAIGIPALMHGLQAESSVGAAPVAVANVPVSLQQDLIATHERCAAQADHHGSTLNTDNDAAIASTMRQQLCRAVLVARPVEQDWHFKGAAICRVGTIPCGHLVFARGDQAVSVFSLPASADPALHDGDEVSLVVAGRPIAGFAKDGALFCLVGSSSGQPVSAAELLQMRDRMENAVTAAPPTATAMAVSPEPDSALAELLQPVDR